jgi:hypothetical protein
LLLAKVVTDSITVKSMASLLEQNTEGYTWHVNCHILTG